jgi:hypothetical protein
MGRAARNRAKHCPPLRAKIAEGPAGRYFPPSFSGWSVAAAQQSLKGLATRPGDFQRRARRLRLPSVTSRRSLGKGKPLVRIFDRRHAGGQERVTELRDLPSRQAPHPILVQVLRVIIVVA